MGDLELDVEQLIAVLELLEGHDFTEFRFEGKEMKIVIRRDLGGGAAEEPRAAHAATPAAAVPAAPVEESEPVVGKTVPVTAPVVGTVYWAPQPGVPPFVEVGDRVTADTVVCLIEVMKLMHSVTAGVAGFVSEICVANGAAVEYDQPLVKLLPEEKEAA